MDTKYGCGYRDGIDDKLWESAWVAGSHFVWYSLSLTDIWNIYGKGQWYY